MCYLSFSSIVLMAIYFLRHFQFSQQFVASFLSYFFALMQLDMDNDNNNNQYIYSIYIYTSVFMAVHS